MQLEVNHFRMFRSSAWARIPIEKRKDLDPQSKACMFVVYYDEVKQCGLLDINNELIFIERSVKFEKYSLHVPPDEPVTKFPSTLIDEYTYDPFLVTHVGPPVFKHRDHTSSCSSNDS